MKKLIIFFCFFTLTITANDFTHKAKYKLHKDQQAWILIKKKTDSSWERYDFSWTLYQDGINIIIHTKYHDFIKQIVLGLLRKRNLFIQKLYLTPKTPYSDDLSLFMEFVDFKTKKLSAITKQNTQDQNTRSNTKNQDTSSNAKYQDTKNKDAHSNTISPPYAVFKVYIKDKNDILDVRFFPKEAVFLD